MKQNVLLLLALAALLGCSKSEYLSDDANGLAIQLSGRINETGATRGEGVLEEPLTSTLEVDIFRADMASPDGSYPDEWEEKISGSIDPRGDITLDPIQYYLDNADQRSGFIGVYPRGDTYDKATRTVTYSLLDGATDVMCSDIAEGYKGVDTNPELKFSHLLTKIQVELKAEGDQDAIKDINYTRGKVSSITLAGKKTGAKVTLPAPNTGVDATIEAITSIPQRDLTLTNKDGTSPDPVSLTGTATPFGYAMFVPTPEGGTETLELTIRFEDGSEETVYTPTLQAYEVGKGYRIVVAFEKEVLEPAVLSSRMLADWDDDTSEIINEPKPIPTLTYQYPTKTPDKLSNAYIVAPNKTVTFPVSRAYKLDSENKFTKNLRAYLLDTEYTGAFETAVVWADASDLIETPTVKGEGKDAVVTVKAKAGAKGNAVVALKKTGGDIVWSYHIWVTGYDPEDTDLQYPNNGFVFMDRNLGAKEEGKVYSVDNAGLYYQWGRKDPFPAKGSVTTADAASNGTIEYTIKNPGTYLTISSSPYDWLLSPVETLWGNDGDKSIYDPCPSGWRVPSSGGTVDNSPWAGFGDASEKPANTVGTFEKGWSWGDNAKYPAAGYRSRATGALGGTNTSGFYWSAAVSSGTYASHLTFVKDAVGVAYDSRRAFGYSVRCVKE